MNKWKLSFTGILFFYATSQAVLSQEAGFVKGMDYGRGIDSVTGKIRNQVVDGRAPKPVDGSELGKEVETKLLWLDDRNAISSSLSGSASASFGLGLFGASASGQFMQKVKTNSYSAYCLVHQKINFAQKNITLPATLTAPAQKAVSGPDFRRGFGDKFVLGITDGAEYYGLVEVRTRSNESRNEVKGSAEGGYFGIGSASAELRRLAETSNINSQLQVYSRQVGGPNLTIPTGIGKPAIEQLLTNINEFSKANFSNCTMPSTAVLIDNEILDPRINNGLALIQKENIEKVCTWLNTYQGYLNDIEYISQYPEEFVSADPKQLQEKADTVATAYNKLMRTLENYVNHPSSTSRLPKGHPILKPKLPNRIPEVICSVNSTVQHWQSSNVTLEAGETAIVRYVDGKWTCGSDHGPASYVDARGYVGDKASYDNLFRTVGGATPEVVNAPFGELLTKVQSAPVRVGNSAILGPYTQSTSVEFRINEDPAAYGDNHGAITVSVLKRRPHISSSVSPNIKLLELSINDTINTGRSAWKLKPVDE